MADSVVQGNKTERSIIDALIALEKLDLELVVIIRGGGSKTELFSLDNEAIARKIATYKHPVWTGIGHEIDISILDHVANRFFKTPTAVAEEVVARFIEMKRHLEEAENRFRSSWSYRMDIETKFIQNSKTGLVNGARKLIENKNSNLKQRVNELSSRIFDRLTREKSILAVWTETLKTAPVVLIQNKQERLADWAKSYMSGCKRRVNEINRYLKDAERLVELIGVSPDMTKSGALKLEYRIKRIPPDQKIIQLTRKESKMAVTKRDLQSLQRQFKALEKKMDKLIAAADKAEIPRAAKKAPAKKAPATMSAARLTATDQVLKIIKRSKKGVDAAALVKKTGFDLKKVRNILQRTYKMGKIKRAGKGVYVGATAKM